MTTGIKNFRHPAGGGPAFLAQLIGTSLFGMAVFHPAIPALSGVHWPTFVTSTHELPAGLFCWFVSSALIRLNQHNFNSPMAALQGWLESAATVWMGLATFGVLVRSINEIGLGLLFWALCYLVASHYPHPLQMLVDIPMRTSVATLLCGLPSLAMTVFAVFTLVPHGVSGIPSNTFVYFSATLAFLFPIIRYQIGYAHLLGKFRMYLADGLSFVLGVCAGSVLLASAFSQPLGHVHEVAMGLLLLSAAWIVRRPEWFRRLIWEAELPDGAYVVAMRPGFHELWTTTFQKQGDVLCPFANEMSFYASGASVKQGMNYFASVVDSYPKGTSISVSFPDGALLRGTALTIYYVLGGNKYVLGRRSRRALGAHKRNLVRVPNSVLNVIPNGASEKVVPAPVYV